MKLKIKSKTKTSVISHHSHYHNHHWNHQNRQSHYHNDHSSHHNYNHYSNKEDSSILKTILNPHCRQKNHFHYHKGHPFNHHLRHKRLLQLNPLFNRHLLRKCYFRLRKCYFRRNHLLNRHLLRKCCFRWNYLLIYHLPNSDNCLKSFLLRQSNIFDSICQSHYLHIFVVYFLSMLITFLFLNHTCYHITVCVS